MLSRLDGNIYTFATDSKDTEPVSINKAILEQAVDDLHNALTNVNSALKQFENNEELSELLTKFCYNAERFFEHKYHIDWCIEELNTLVNYAKTHQDAIPDKYDILTLTEVGYRLRTNYKDHYMYELILEDTPDREVVNEIQFNLEDPDELVSVRRRTIEFEIVPHGRSSKSIVYEDLVPDDTLMKLIHNTKREEWRKHGSKASR